MDALPLEPAVLRNFGIAVHFPPPEPSVPAGAPSPAPPSPGGGGGGGAPPPADQRVSGLCFSDTGAALYASSRDGVLSVFDGATGRRAADLLVRETGCRLVTATHSPHAVLHASDARAGPAGVVTYHDIYANRAVRAFRGHAGAVTSLSVKPDGPDVFLSVSADGLFFLWDLRAAPPAARGTLRVPDAHAGAEPAAPVAAFDHAGVCFAVATPSRGLALYNATKLGAPAAEWVADPFQSLDAPLFNWLTQPFRGVHAPPGAALPPPLPSTVSFAGVEFSPDDKLLALATADRGVLVLDAYETRREVAVLAAHPADPAHPSVASWSPDGRWLAVGGVDGHVYAYDLAGRPDAVAAPGGPPAPPWPWQPGVFEPPVVLLGDERKTPAARAAAAGAAAAFRARARDVMEAQRVKFAAARGVPVETLGPPRSVPSFPPPLPGGPDEQVSRLEGPVPWVRWHPAAAALAAGSRGVAVFSPPAPGADDADDFVE